MNHPRLLRIATFMWAVPLVAGTATMLGFLFLRAPFFVASGMILLAVGGLLYLTGTLLMAYNLWKTATGAQRAAEPAAVPAASLAS